MILLPYEQPWSDSPLAAGIAGLRTSSPNFLWVPGGEENYARDQVNNLPGTPAAGALFEASGLSVPIANGAGSYLKFATNAGVSGASTPFIGLMLVTVRDPSAVTGAFLKIGGAPDGLGFGAGGTTFDDVGSGLIALREALAWHTGSGTLVAGLNILTFGYTTNSVLAVINMTNSSETSAVVGSWLAPSAELYINGYATNRSSNVKVHAVYVSARSFDNTAFVAERERLAALFGGLSRVPREDVDAWFEPERILVPVAAGGGGSYTLTVTPGSYAVSGQSVNLRAARKLSVTQGTYALAGQPVAIGVGRKLAVTQGSYALSGQPVVLRAARRLSVTQGNYALNGQNVTLTKASASSLGVTPGAYSLSGQSVTLLASRKLTATQGAYSLSGQNVTLTKSAAGGLNVTAGSYSLNGQSVGLNTARRLSVAQGAYALSGQQVGLYAAAAPLIVTRGLYVLTGQDVQLHRALRLSVTSGVYAMTGRSVTLLYSAAVSNERDMSAAPRVPRAAGPSRPAQLSSARRPTPSNGTRL